MIWSPPLPSLIFRSPLPLLPTSPLTRIQRTRESPPLTLPPPPFPLQLPPTWQPKQRGELLPEARAPRGPVGLHVCEYARQGGQTERRGPAFPNRIRAGSLFAKAHWGEYHSQRERAQRRRRTRAQPEAANTVHLARSDMSVHVSKTPLPKFTAAAKKKVTGTKPGPRERKQFTTTTAKHSIPLTILRPASRAAKCVLPTSERSVEEEHRGNRKEERGKTLAEAMGRYAREEDWHAVAHKGGDALHSMQTGRPAGHVGLPVHWRIRIRQENIPRAQRIDASRIAEVNANHTKNGKTNRSNKRRNTKGAEEETEAVFPVRENCPAKRVIACTPKKNGGRTEQREDERDRAQHPRKDVRTNVPPPKSKDVSPRAAKVPDEAGR
ncbi:hypothetical protein B0H16DRAFT_1857630 [Mycena metata]|uniref:Uncharacterized protein n=1 Tax=Mycena metata TaxID=1033252 RepID=A0AAD7DI79_9AGAR|nr:hypothetical protein B0H16DRAFT_1857630 [Mycena metata]